MSAPGRNTPYQYRPSYGSGAVPAAPPHGARSFQPLIPGDTQALLPRPASHREGVLNRALLVQGEQVIFETGPSFLGYSWIRLVLYGFFLLVFGLAAELQPAILLNPAYYFFIVVLVALVIHRVYVWSRTAYAVTNMRVISTGGLLVNGLDQAYLDNVRRMTVGGAYGRASPSRPCRASWAPIP